MNALIYADERLDDLQIGGFKLIQSPGTFCFGTDAVLLADFAAPRQHERAVDLGAGNGIIAVLMAAHQPLCEVDAVEIQSRMADMAARSMQLNGITERVRVHCADMRDLAGILEDGRYSLVVSNPPYSKAGSGETSANDAVRTARFEESVTAEELCKSAARLLKYGGRFCVVFPSFRAFELMNAMHANHMEPKRIRTVHARAERPPKLVLIEAVKGGKSGIQWMGPLILYDENGKHSAEWDRIYATETLAEC